MRALIRLHLAYVLTRKTRIFLTVHVLVSLGVLFYVTRYYDDAAMRVVMRRAYGENYMLDSMHFLQLASLILILYLALAFFHGCPYDIMVVQRSPHGLFIFSKWISMILMGGVYLTICAIYYAVFGMIAGYYFTELRLWDLLRHLWIMMMHHGTLAMLMLIVFRHIFVVFAILCGSVAGRILIDYGIALDDVGFLAYVLNLVFINVHLLADGKMTLLFTTRTVLALCALMLVLSIHRYTDRDM